MRTFVTSQLIIVFSIIVGCSSTRILESDIPSISGKWSIHQINSGGQEFAGTLYLEQKGLSFSGSVAWNNQGRASIVNGTISQPNATPQGSIISFVIQYDRGLRGKYYATLSSTDNKMFDGTTIVIEGGSDIGTWDATLVKE